MQIDCRYRPRGLATGTMMRRTLARGATSMNNTRMLLAIATLIVFSAGSLLVRTVSAEDASVGIRKAQIYPSIDRAGQDIKAAIAEARRQHKRVILDFGGDWCPDCQVLNIYFHQAPNDHLVAKNFVRVNVNVGHLDANQDIAARYGVALKGVPALAVLDGAGHVIYAQNKEFSDMRHLDSSALTGLLQQWKP
jgi:thioredoxin 1